MKTGQILTRTENRIQTGNQILTEAKMTDNLLKNRKANKTEMPIVILIRTENQTLIKNQAINLITQTVALGEEKAGGTKEKMSLL